MARYKIQRNVLKFDIPVHILPGNEDKLKPEEISVSFVNKQTKSSLKLADAAELRYSVYNNQVVVKDPHPPIEVFCDEPCDIFRKFLQWGIADKIG